VQPLPRRQEQVLQATVRHYVDTTEPVGSKTLVRRFGLDASPATIRSAMGALEQRGLLTQPHTSAGRVPSPLGYRHYVNCLLPAPGAAVSQLQRELAGLSLQWAALDDLLLHLARRLADLTGLLSLITRPQQGTPPLERWLSDQLNRGQLDWSSLPPQLQRSGALVRQGLSSHAQARHGGGAVAMGLGGLLRQPEFERSDSLRPLLQLVEEAPQALLESEQAQHPERLGVWIGSEHPNPALHHCAVVQAPYSTGSGAQGQVALVGPMRMAYSTARAAVQAVASSLERLLS
jgi:heat-inducible transcriptional repressor